MKRSATSLATTARLLLAVCTTFCSCVNSVRPSAKYSFAAHCRRRKIRCIPYVNDPQGRCQNCIRLKKECTFHSVGQEAPPSAMQRPGARIGSGPKIASASTSPVATSHSSAISPNQPFPQISAVSSLQNMGPPIKPEAFSRDAKCECHFLSQPSWNGSRFVGVNIVQCLPVHRPAGLSSIATVRARGYQQTRESMLPRRQM